MATAASVVVQLNGNESSLMSIRDANHPLDYPIWTALTTTQQALAEGDARARRFPIEITPFAATADMSPESFAALGALMSPQDIAVLFTPDPVEPPAGFKVALADTGEQLIGPSVETPANGVDIVTLGVDDVPAMIELTALTKPGPFYARTHELGTFLGIRVDGQLVAMAGERMKPAHYTEITAVCVHPSHRGRGYGQMLLIRDLSPDSIARRDSLPARLHQQSLGDCALPAAGHGNPPPPPCDGVEERGLIVQRCAP